MKEFILGAIKRIANILLVISIVSAASSLVLTMIPELVEELGLNLTQENLGWLTGALGMAASAGGMAKYSSTVLTKITALNKSELERKITFQDEKHQEEINAIRNQHAEELVLFTDTINDVINEVKSLRTENQKILEVNAITAKRNISSNLVTDEDKQLYKTFLSNIESDKPSNLKNVYTTISNVIEKIEEKPQEIEEEKAEDLIEQKLLQKEV
jgi:golgin subfamily B member 1